MAEPAHGADTEDGDLAHPGVDVAVIGGGPAGAAAALALLRYTALRVAVIERSTYDTWRPGEVLPPEVLPLLRYLDAEAILDAQAHLVAHGSAASWGTRDLVSRDFLFMARGSGWHLDRRRFDRALASLVAARGGRLLLGATAVGDTWGDTAWRLQVLLAGATRRAVVTARFVIDASGRRGSFARRRGSRRRLDDRLFGVVSLCRNRDEPAPDRSVVVEADPLGWWYSAPLPERATTVALMTDPDIIRQHRLHTRDAWWHRLQSTVHTRRRLSGARPEASPMICAASSQMLDVVCGDRWIAAGEAVVAFDPLSSMGIGYAIASGIHAARAAQDVLEAGGVLAREYAESIRQHYQQYLRRRRAYYAMEQRWPDDAFWARRRTVGV